MLGSTLSQPTNFHSWLATWEGVARAKQGYEVVSWPGASAKTIEERVQRLQLGQHKNDCLLLVGTTAARPGSRGIHHRMMGRRSDNRLAMTPTGSTPLFAVGHPPATSPAQAQSMIAKILAFEQGRATPDRKAVLLAGNPMGGHEHFGPADFLVASLSKSLMKKPDDSWKFTGAADVHGHPFEVKTEDYPATRLF